MIPTFGIPTVGIVANPLAGKDIRRLVAEASPTSDMAKVGIVRRAIIGAVEGGACRVILADDRRGLGFRAIDGLNGCDDAVIEVLDEPIIDSGGNSQRAARLCHEKGAGALIVLGGDGTHRDVVKGWNDAPLVALSTGTNNVFPRHIEATVAGHAAGLVASGRVPLAEAANRVKRIDVEVDGQADDLALVDVALVADIFTASRAVWDPDSLHELVVCIAEPGSVGLSAIPAAVAPTGRFEEGGVHVRFANRPEDGPSAITVRAPIAPGLYADASVADFKRIDTDDVIEVEGPGTLSFDGERDVTLKAGQAARIRISNEGPYVIDVARTMAAAGGQHSDTEEIEEKD